MEERGWRVAGKEIRCIRSTVMEAISGFLESGREVV